MFNLAPLPLGFQKPCSAAPGSLWSVAMDPEGHRAHNNHNSGRGSHILRCHPFSLPLSSKLRGRLIMIKLYLQKLFVNEIGFMNQQMASGAV